jgi:tripartite-type tricarboxylate transporter receptor subunit TctC
MMKKRNILGLAAALSMGVAGISYAGGHGADIPCSTAKLIVPWGAGGGTDVIFRQIVDVANNQGMKPQLQVVNVGGQGGNKGAKQAVAAKPDGCTLFAMHQSAITSYLTGRVNFTWDGFEPIALMTNTPSIFGAAGNTSYSNLNELIAEIKKNPGTVTAGATLGSTSQVVFLFTEDATGGKFKYVSYDGTKQRMTALLAGNIQVGEINLAAAKKYIETGKLKALGVMSNKRLSGLDNIPTAKEQGLDVVFGVERGIVAPKGTSEAIVKHYAAAFQKAASDEKLIASMLSKGTFLEYVGPSEYAAKLDETTKKWTTIFDGMGLLKVKN